MLTKGLTRRPDFSYKWTVWLAWYEMVLCEAYFGITILKYIPEVCPIPVDKRKKGGGRGKKKLCYF